MITWARTDVTPLGAALHDYAKNVAESNFRQVSIYASAAEAVGQADAILIPKVSKTDESYGIGFGTKHSMVIVVEWSLKDRDNQKDLWLDTVDGRAEVPEPTVFTRNSSQRKLVQKMFDDLSAKTQKEFAESVEIKKLAGSTSP